MPVEAPDSDDHVASRKAANEYCKSLGSTFAVEANITTQNIATLMTMLLSIASDCGPEIVPMLILFLDLTDRAPLASMTLTIRFSVVDRQAFYPGAGAPGCTRVQNPTPHFCTRTKKKLRDIFFSWRPRKIAPELGCTRVHRGNHFVIF